MKHQVATASTAFLLALSLPVCAQQRLAGKVVDATTGQPVPYASIGVLGTTRGTTSNAEGEFELREVTLPGRLVVSELGHRRDTVAVTQAGASQPLQVRLAPASVMLPDVQVGNYAAELIARAYRELRRTNAQKTYSQAFYRQTTRVDGDVTEVQEMVWHAQTSNARIEGTALAQARFAKKKALLSFKDLSTFPRRVTFFDPAVDSLADKSVISLHVADVYRLSVLGMTQDGPAQLIEIGFVNKDPAGRVPRGSVVINDVTNQILRLRLETTALNIVTNNPAFKMTNQLTKLEWVFRPRPGQATILEQLRVNYAGTMSRLLKGDIPLTASSFSYFYEGQPTPRAGVTYAPAQLNTSDLAAIKKTTYDPAFWLANAVVKRTPLEDEAMRSFEQKGAFGTMLTP
ncbi:MAG: carboxypeptidase-like regulatory domain-containing protein [Janthinobacterium lividum]